MKISDHVSNCVLSDNGEENQVTANKSVYLRSAQTYKLACGINTAIGEC
jgi:hypothetical protein